MTDLEALKAKLSQQIKNSRVGYEAQNLSGQYFAGTIWFLVLRTAAYALAIIGAYWFVARSFDGCTSSCFLAAHGETCCWASQESLIAALFILVVAFFGSFFSTRSSLAQHFQASAMTSAFVLMSVGLLLFLSSAPTLFALPFFIAMFIALFTGYRRAL